MMETLLTMTILSLFIPILFFVTYTYSSFERFPYEVQDQIGLAQLRRFLNGCPILSVTSQQLVCQNGKEWILRASDHHLYLSDGTLIVLEGVNQIYFELKDNLVYLHYVRLKTWKQALIGHV